MIPAFVQLQGAPHLVLPPGIHWATIGEIEARFATTPRRRLLFEGLLRAASDLQRAGCARLFLDGSFVTSKESPGDFDGCWDPSGVVAAMLDPVLLDFSSGRLAQKRKYLGELFVATMPNGFSGTFLEFFQVEKHTGASKGIIGIALGNSVASGVRP